MMPCTLSHGPHTKNCAKNLLSHHTPYTHFHRNIPSPCKQRVSRLASVVDQSAQQSFKAPVRARAVECVAISRVNTHDLSHITHPLLPLPCHAAHTSAHSEHQGVQEWIRPFYGQRKLGMKEKTRGRRKSGEWRRGDWRVLPVRSCRSSFWWPFDSCLTLASFTHTHHTHTHTLSLS